MFYLDSLVRYSDIGSDQKMSVPAVLDLLQDCCTFHSEKVGVGISFLQQAQRAWVLSFLQVKITRYPAMGESVRTYTWPSDFKNFLGYRNFKIEGMSQELIACAHSIWVYIDIKSGRPVRLPEDVRQRYQLYNEPCQLECTSRKINLPEEMQSKEPVRVSRFLIDTNQHVNNSKYVMLAGEYLPVGFCVGTLRVEYKKAAVLSDVIYPRVYETARQVIVSLENHIGESYAIIEFREDEV